MIPPIQGSILFQDSSLNMTPMENCNISSYKDQNEISQDVLDRAWNIFSMVKYSYPEGDRVTCGSPYNFAMLNNPETSHLGKRFISSNWWNLWCWKEDRTLNWRNHISQNIVDLRLNVLHMVHHNFSFDLWKFWLLSILQSRDIGNLPKLHFLVF